MACQLLAPLPNPFLPRSFDGAIVITSIVALVGSNDKLTIFRTLRLLRTLRPLRLLNRCVCGCVRGPRMRHACAGSGSVAGVARPPGLLRACFAKPSGESGEERWAALLWDTHSR